MAGSGSAEMSITWAPQALAAAPSPAPSLPRLGDFEAKSEHLKHPCLPCSYF